ncbi:Probable RNA-directed DNA polymerase from transposon BS [Eumeta japonica]|uniref:Probable RNA-directed DNA polymerase from transposon BS n=1 Tax=Eumeta variegata TaxID=151549 RepID=A0A4C1VDE3_EUMVA|nr:Probable RNA-directed DNA polymerase from transposon BS [Eumeta japonica]
MHQIGIFCDLSKAFDCVHHDTLIRKLRHFGVTGRSLGLLESCLRDRIQRADINGQRSSGSVVNTGVPQNSVLRPFLFLVYINDLPSGGARRRRRRRPPTASRLKGPRKQKSFAYKLLKRGLANLMSPTSTSGVAPPLDLPHLVKNGHGIILFADDTSLLFKIDRHQPAFDEVNSTISEIIEWFSINNLLLNERKTKLVKFSLPDSKLIDTNVMVKNEVLYIVDTNLFLSFTLDFKLRWNFHITRLSKRLDSAAYAVKRIRRIQTKAPRV